MKYLSCILFSFLFCSCITTKIDYPDCNFSFGYSPIVLPMLNIRVPFKNKSIKINTVTICNWDEEESINLTIN